LIGRLGEVEISEEDDRVVWALEKGGQFSTRSMYRFLSFGGMANRRMQEVWRALISMKEKVFMWRMFNDKLQTVEQLKKREWKGEINFPLCEVKEDVNHIMFGCVISTFVWVTLREAFGWSNFPASLEGFVSSWLGRCSGKYVKLRLFDFEVVCWVLWKVRNKMMIEHKLVSSPRVVIFNILMLMQQWKVLLLVDAQETVEAAAKILRLKMKRGRY
jgi:hypothetical protein